MYTAPFAIYSAPNHEVAKNEPKHGTDSMNTTCYYQMVANIGKKNGEKEKLERRVARYFLV